MNLNIQNIRTGKTIHFKKVVEDFWPRLFRFCCIYIQDREIAKDIVQEVFISLWQNRKHLSDDTQLITYLMVASRNKCLNYIRNKQRSHRMKAIELTEEAIYLKANEYALESESSIILDSLDLRAAIENALSNLRLKTREIFYMHYYSGLMISEISLKTNLAEKTIEYHLSRAMKELRKKLSPSDFLLILLFYQL